jgi:hypothetical protein
MERPDNNFNHLYPAFRAKLEEVLRRARRETGYAWVMTEGYRSAKRQTWLYAQGRTRPGPIVTWLKTPKHHGVGLAADCYPSSNGISPDFSLPHQLYIAYRAIYRAQGLENPAWIKGDYGHVQWPASDTATHVQAGAWCRNGFQDPSPKLSLDDSGPDAGVPVYVDGVLVPDAGGIQEAGRVNVRLRPVAEALDWSILSATGGQARLADEHRLVTVKYELVGTRAYVPVRHLCELLEVRCEWDGRAVRIA